MVIFDCEANELKLVHVPIFGAQWKKNNELFSVCCVFFHSLRFRLNFLHEFIID